MSIEQRSEGVALTGIYIDLSNRAITFEAGNKPIAKVIFSSGTLYFQTPSQRLSSSPETVEESPARVSGPPENSAPSEDVSTAEVRGKESTVILSGRLKSKPREGRPDRSDKPTAWARLAAHQDGEEKAHLYSITFHRHTARIALGLDSNAPITVEGYRHIYNDAQRMDTLSVINILSYPGKQPSP